MFKKLSRYKAFTVFGEGFRFYSPIPPVCITSMSSTAWKITACTKARPRIYCAGWSSIRRGDQKKPSQRESLSIN